MQKEMKATRPRNQFRIIDLSYPISEGMLRFQAPWHPDVKLEAMGSIETVGRNTTRISLGSHTGTHMDAPRHFIGDGASIESLPLSLLVGKVSIMDFSSMGPNSAVAPGMFENKKLGKRVIFRFGWGRKWGDLGFYKDYPFFSPESARLLAAKGVELLCMDTPSPDDSRIRLGSEEDSKIHKIMLSSGITLVEYLANLDQVDDMDGWSIIAMPLKIAGADGSPARVCIFK